MITCTFSPPTIYAGGRHNQQHHQNGQFATTTASPILYSSRTWQDQLREAVVSFNAIGQPPIFSERITNHRSSCTNRLSITELVFYSEQSKTPNHIFIHRLLSFVIHRVAIPRPLPKGIDSGVETPHAHRRPRMRTGAGCCHCVSALGDCHHQNAPPQSPRQ